MFARHYLRNLGWFLFLRVLRWFSSPGSLLLSYVFRQGYRTECGGFPHSDIAGSQLYCQLPRAFRRLTRPSSPIIAKASTWCTYSLDSIISRTSLTWLRSRWLGARLEVLTLIKLTALLCDTFCLLCSECVRYNHHPNCCGLAVQVGQPPFQAAFNLLKYGLLQEPVFPSKPTLSLFVDFGFPIC